MKGKRMTVEQTINKIAEMGRDKVTYVELTVAVNVNRIGVSNPSYSMRAWWSEATATPPSCAAYDLERLAEFMVRAMEKYPLPEMDKQQKITLLKKQIEELEKK